MIPTVENSFRTEYIQKITISTQDMLANDHLQFKIIKREKYSSNIPLYRIYEVLLSTYSQAELHEQVRVYTWWHSPDGQTGISVFGKSRTFIYIHSFNETHLFLYPMHS